MSLLPLEDQIDALVEMGKIREALALCRASGAAGGDFTDALRVALGVQLCDEVRRPSMSAVLLSVFFSALYCRG